MMMRLFPRFWMATLLLLVLPATSIAQTCSPTSSTGITFGTINTATTPTQDVTGTITVTCTAATGSNIGKTARVCSYLGTGSTSANKTMVSGANTINYNVFADAARSIYYCSQTVGPETSQVYVMASTPTVLTFTMYGRVFSGQTVAPGTYAATLPTVARIITPSNQACTAGPTTPSVSVNFQVDLTPSCSISATPISFGTVNTLASTLNSSGSLSVTCSKTAAYTISLSAGTSIGNTIAARKMSVGGTGAGVVDYQLYRDAGPSNVWGNGTTGVVYSGSGTATAQTIPVYAQVPAQAPPPAGAFKDTVTATITF